LGNQNFNYMEINELKQHEKGILNLFEGEGQMAKYVSHNKTSLAGGRGSKSTTYVRLSQVEYESIFERDPSFNEKKAFVDVFRRKWKEDKGYTSMFHRRQGYKLAKSASNDALDRRRRTKSNLKTRIER